MTAYRSTGRWFFRNLAARITFPSDTNIPFAYSSILRMRDRAATNHNVTNKWSESSLFVTLIALLLVGSLGGWLLLLLLVLGLGARSLCQG